MRNIYMIFLLIASGLIIMGSSSGTAANQNKDRTGSPVADGTCGNCHGGGNHTISIEMLEDGNTVTSYQPGQSYTMRLSINGNSFPAYGFQAVALQADNTQGGSFTPSDGTIVTVLNDREYIEQSRRSASNVFEVTWTAPTTASGDISFYSSGVAANEGNGNNGDRVASLSTPFVMTQGVVGTQNTPPLVEQLTAFPNPSTDYVTLNFSSEITTAAQLIITNALGQQIQKRALPIGIGTNQQTVDISSLPTGTYTFVLTTGHALSSITIVK